MDLKTLLSSLTSSPTLAIFREARSELSPEEVSRLSPEQLQTKAAIRNPARLLEWSEARRGEWEIRARLGGSGVKMSVSHAREGAVPWVCVVGAQGVAGIGVDLERSAREISETAIRRFVSPDEAPLPGLSPIRTWVIKEALFKADPKNQGRVISDYRILSFESHGPKSFGAARIDEREIRFGVFEDSGWIVGAAVA